MVANHKTFPCQGKSISTLSPCPSNLKASVETTPEAETVFQFEEESHEAIIDTGASRAVVGSDRLSSLVASCGMEGKVKVAIIDVDGGMLWFKGSTTGVPLKPCRKNLMSVHFGKILAITPEPQTGEREEIHMTTQNNELNEEDHGKYCLTNHPGESETMDDVQVKVGRQVCRIASPAAVCSNQPSSQSIRSSGSDVQSHDRPQLSGQATRHQSGPEPHHAQEGIGDPSGCVPKTTGSEHTPRVGSHDPPRREIQGQDVRGGLHRPELRVSTPKSKGNINMGQEFPDVRKSEGASRSHSFTGDVQQGDPSDHGDAQSDRDQGWKHDPNSKGFAEGRAKGDVKRGIRGVGEGQGKTSSEGRPTQAPSFRGDEKRSSSIIHDDGTQCRESPTDSNSDRFAPTGTGQRDTDPKRCRVKLNDEISSLVSYIDSNTPLPRLTAVQEKLIHQELALKTEEIQDGLSTLPKNAGKMENQQHLKSGTRNGHLQSRPLDLLEVYRGPNSQITTHVNRKGGHAMRFTFNDGDLGTLEGVQKLWLWIYMYEPRHIWLAPECRLWGKFSNLNMSTRRRMARERRGAGSSLVSMETQFYKQYMKDVL